MNIIDEMFLQQNDMIISEPVRSSQQMVIALEFYLQMDGKLLYYHPQRILFHLY